MKNKWSKIQNHLYKLILFTCLITIFVSLTILRFQTKKEREFGLSDRYKNYLEVVDSNGVSCSKNGQMLWSTYPSLEQERKNCFTPVGDLMIHALGKRKNLYVDEFESKKPKFVETINTSYALWEYWLRSNYWDFYEDLFTWYSPVALTDHSIFWKRNQEENTWLKKSVGNQKIKLNSIGVGRIEPPINKNFIGTVKVKYSTRQPISFLPILGKQAEFTANIKGGLRFDEEVTLDPASTIKVFPVQWNGTSSDFSVNFSKKGLAFFDSFTILDVEIMWHEKPIDENNLWNEVFKNAS